MDPPRAGLDKDVVKAIASSGVKKLVYISSNPQTLGRDIGSFMKYDYELKKISAVDMFPQTMHCEMICLLKRIMN